MKNIPLLSLPKFQGTTNEDLDIFLFLFDVLYQSYDYTSDAQKLKLFPTTLKGVVFRWFMGLGNASISSLDDIKKTFLEKYQDYCKIINQRGEFFIMSQRGDGILEEYIECLQYKLQSFNHSDLDKDILKFILIWGMKDDCMDTLNLIGKGDI